MDNHEVLETLKLLKEHSKKRKFSQSIDLIINLKGLNLKKPEENIKNYVILPHSLGKTSKVGIFLGDELIGKAKGVCDVIIHKDEFQNYQKDSKKVKKLSKDVDVLIAQANLMPDIAKSFGKVLGPRGKMPDPNAGAIVPPAIPDLNPIVEKLRRTVKLQTKNELIIKTSVGREDMSDDQIVENIMAVYNNITHSVKDPKHMIKSVILKLTMGKSFIIGKKYEKKELEEGKGIKKVKKDVKVNETKAVKEGVKEGENDG